MVAGADALAALAVAPADVTPFGPAASLADPATVESLLTGAGWHDVSLTDLRATMTLGPTLDEALDQARGAQAITAAIERAGEAVVLPAVRAALEPWVGDDGAVRSSGAAWLVTATA